jgi:hypothetical protein
MVPLELSNLDAAYYTGNAHSGFVRRRALPSFMRAATARRGCTP